MTKQITRFGVLASSVLGATLLLALFAIGVAASAPAVPAPDPDGASAAIVASTPITLPSPSWRIGITADGLYQLSYEALEAAGVPTGVASSAYHLLWRDQEVAMQEIGDGDSDFEPGEAFRFYAVKFHGSTQDEKYTDENVYWLTVDNASFFVYLPLVLNGSGEDGSNPITKADAAETAWYTATAHAEENLVYWARWSNTPGTDTTWFWERIATATPTTHTYPVTLTEPVPGSYTATLFLEVAGRSTDFLVDPDHHLRLSVNGAPVGEWKWDGKVGATFTLPVPSTALVEGVNQVGVTVLTDLSTNQDIYVDRIEVGYRRAYIAEDDSLSWTTSSSGTQSIEVAGFSTPDVQLYDVTHPLTSTRLIDANTVLSGTTYSLYAQDTAPAGTVYLAAANTTVMDVPSLSVYYPPSDLINPVTGADEIILAHGDFITAVQPLADYRRAQGLRVRVVDVEDAYALFNGGVVHPEAIRSFVAHAYANWPGKPPAFLLLVGDGNFNLKGYNPTSYGEYVPSLIPPYLGFYDLDQGEVPVDSRFGDVDLNWDNLPEVMVGRISANSVAQVEGAVDKIIAYESEAPAAWMDRVIHVADDGDGLQEGFSQILDDLERDYLPTGVETRTVYIEDYCAIAPETPCPSATLALTQTWSAGGALLSYAGHGAVNRWASEPLLLNTQLATLTGTSGLPFVISLDCWDGYWMFPPKYPGFGNNDINSTGEWATTVLTDRGAIAVFGPAGLGYPTIEKVITQRMYQAMFQEGEFQLGPLTQLGREAVYWDNLARTYTLLGDPALYLPWWDHLTIAPSTHTMNAGTSIPLSATFTVTGTTRFGQEFVVTPTWTADAGSIDGWGNYTAPNTATTVQLTAHKGAVSATVTINVTAGGADARMPASTPPSAEIEKAPWNQGFLLSGLPVAALATLQEKFFSAGESIEERAIWTDEQRNALS
jgi:hypothetical protein